MLLCIYNIWILQEKILYKNKNAVFIEKKAHYLIQMHQGNTCNINMHMITYKAQIALVHGFPLFVCVQKYQNWRLATDCHV
jgi:hypothetical protein